MEVLAYIAVIAIGYIVWVKIKAFFTGRTWNEQVSHDEARKNERVCRNCRRCWGNECLEYDQRIDPDRDSCSSFNKR